MTAQSNGIRYALAVAMLALVGTALSPNCVQAQQVVMVESSIGFASGTGGSSRVSSRSIESYSSLLGMDEDQAEIARELHQQYVSDMTDASQKRRATMQSVMAEFHETEDHSILREKMPELMEEADKREKAIEVSLFDDLRLLLDEEQAGRWERVERLRRRETILRQGGLSGETTDLILIAEDVLEEVGIAADVAEALGRYEMELDRALLSKAKVQEEAQDVRAGMMVSFDLESMEKAGKKTREAGLRVREVNRRHARVIESLLPAELALAFHEETKRRNFPPVYRESRVDRLLAAAKKLTDLEPDQVTSIDGLGISYGRERSAADTKWSAAIAKDDEEGGSGFSTGSMTLRIMLHGNEGDESPVAKAGKDRRDLDQKFENRLLAILDKEQRDRMPKPSDHEANHMDGSFVPGLVIESIGRPDRH